MTVAFLALPGIAFWTVHIAELDALQWEWTGNGWTDSTGLLPVVAIWPAIMFVAGLASNSTEAPFGMRATVMALDLSPFALVVLELASKIAPTLIPVQ